MPAAANLLAPRARDCLPPDDPVAIRTSRSSLSMRSVNLASSNVSRSLPDEGMWRSRERVGIDGIELRFELRRLYLRLMGDPKSVLFATSSQRAEEIAAEAAGARTIRSLRARHCCEPAGCSATSGDTRESELVVAAHKSASIGRASHSAELAFVTSPHVLVAGPEYGRGGQRACRGGAVLRRRGVADRGVQHARPRRGSCDDRRLRRGTVARSSEAPRSSASSAWPSSWRPPWGCRPAIVEMIVRRPRDAAEARLRPAYETLKAMGEKARLSSRAAILASIVYEQGRYEEAMVLVDEDGFGLGGRRHGTADLAARRASEGARTPRTVR